MRASKGFTLIEMMIGSVVLLVVILLTTSFFRAQSQFGGEIVKETGSRETLSQVVALLRRDIMHAGHAIQNVPELGLWASGYDSSTASFHKLYVNCAYFASTLPNKSFSVYSYSYATNQSAIFQGAGITQFTLPLVRPEDIYGVVSYSSLNGRQFTKTTGSYNPMTDQTTFTLDTPAGADPFTPVIYYALVDTADGKDAPPYTSSTPDKFELRRNGLSLVGGASDPLTKISDFSIRCQFIVPITQTTENIVTLPTNTELTFESEPYGYLRTIEIQIKYKTLKPGANPNLTQNWRQKIKLVAVSPRNMVFAAYK